MRDAAARRFVSLGLRCTLALAVSAGPAYAFERFGGFGGRGFFHGNGGGYHGSRDGGIRVQVTVRNTVVFFIFAGR